MKHLPRVICLGLVILASGCARWDPVGSGFNDGTSHWADKMRSPTEKGQMTGFDGRAREIERNLGVR